MNLVNLENIGNVVSTVKDRVKSYFISESPDEGIIDLRLDIIGEETLTADSDITDNYVENNTSYQDQISLKPKIFTIQGEVGELVWYQRDPNEQGLGQLAQRLEGVVSFLPIKSRSFNQMKSTVMEGLQWVDTASNAIDKINKLSDENGNAQQQAYIHLLSLRDERKPITIQSPWELLVDYVIQSVKFTQPKETKDKTLISITFKEFRQALLGETVPFDENKYQGNAVFENQPMVDNGTVSGLDSTVKTYEKEEIENSLPDLSSKMNEGDRTFISSDIQNAIIVDPRGDQKVLERVGEKWVEAKGDISSETMREFQMVEWEAVKK